MSENPVKPWKDFARAVLHERKFLKINNLPEEELQRDLAEFQLNVSKRR
jgi:hypothetical protein